MRFILRGQLENGAQAFDTFIDSEAWRIGGNLEDYATRLAEIDGAEIGPVLLFRGADTVLVQRFGHYFLRGVVSRPEGDVMDRARAHVRGHPNRIDNDIDMPADDVAFLAEPRRVAVAAGFG